MKSVYKSILVMIMKAMVLKTVTRLADNREPLELSELPVPMPRPHRCSVPAPSAIAP